LSIRELPDFSGLAEEQIRYKIVHALLFANKQFRSYMIIVFINTELIIRVFSFPTPYLSKHCAAVNLIPTYRQGF